MRVTAHQPQAFPWLGLIHKISEADAFVSWNTVQAEDSGFENRQYILGPTGPQWLTIPVMKSRELAINELKIANDQPWRRKHWRSIELAYSKAPLWKAHGEYLQWLYAQEWEKLEPFCDEVLRYLAIHFGLTQIPRYRLSDLELKPHEPVLKAGPKPTFVDAKNQLIIDAVRALDGRHYVFGSQGRGYVDRQAFADAGIEPWIQTYEPVEYTQAGHDGFHPRMWAFDLLLNKERDEAIEIMLTGGKVERMG